MEGESNDKVPRIWVRPGLPKMFETGSGNTDDTPSTILPRRGRDLEESISTGSFGNLVRRANQDLTQDPDDWVRQRIHYKLMKINTRTDKSSGQSGDSWDDLV